MTDKKENKKSDEEILFPEVKIGGYVVKPWSFGILFSISELLEQVLDKIEEKNLMDVFDTEFMSYISMARLFTVAGSQVLKIISITLDEDEEEIKKLDMKDGIKIATTIYQQNLEILKNAVGPLLSNIAVDEEKEEKEETKIQ